MNNYELVLIISSSESAEEQKKIISKVEKALSQKSGKIASNEEWGKKTFSYPIKKTMDGFYFLLKFSAEASVAEEVNKNLGIEDKVLRHLLIKV